MAGARYVTDSIVALALYNSTIPYDRAPRVHCLKIIKKKNFESTDVSSRPKMEAITRYSISQAFWVRVRL